MSKFEIYENKDVDASSRWHWRLLDGDNETVAKNKTPFVKGDAKRLIKAIQAQVTPNTTICHDDGKSHGDYFSYYRSDNDGRWYWKLRIGADSNDIAIESKSFESEDDVKKALESIRKEICRAGISFANPHDDPAYDAQETNKRENTDTKIGISGS